MLIDQTPISFKLSDKHYKPIALYNLNKSQNTNNIGSSIDSWKITMQLFDSKIGSRLSSTPLL